MKRLFYALIVLIGVVGIAWAGTNTLLYTNSGTINLRTTTDVSGNNLGNMTLWDSVAGGNGLAITVGNAAKVDGSAVTQPVSGTITALVNAQATGGASITSNIVPNNTTAVVVKTGAGTVYGFYGYSISASTPAWLKIYDATSATCGAGTPTARLLIPYDSTTSNNGTNMPIPAAGIAFNTGITYCVTTGIADNNTTAPAASTYVVNLVWK